jgi:hypothetical protein
MKAAYGMAHEHSHEQDPYYLDQLCTIAICGALGGVAIMMYRQGELKALLHERFQLAVLYGGIVLVALAVIRAVALWFAVDPQPANPGDRHHHHDHDHSHGDHSHGHGHDHGHSHGHGHDHGHDHGWNPWRYAVLLLPIVLFFMNLNLTARGFSADYIKRQLGQDDLEQTGLLDVASKGGSTINLNFNELDQAAYSQERRDYYEGRIGRLKGQFLPGQNDEECNLVRLKIFCCAQDVLPLRVRVISPEKLPAFDKMAWVEVEGQVQFRKRKDRDEYVPVLQLESAEGMKASDPDPNIYLQAGS